MTIHACLARCLALTVACGALSVPALASRIYSEPEAQLLRTRLVTQVRFTSAEPLQAVPGVQVTLRGRGMRHLAGLAPQVRFSNRRSSRLGVASDSLAYAIAPGPGWLFSPRSVFVRIQYWANLYSPIARASFLRIRTLEIHLPVGSPSQAPPAPVLSAEVVAPGTVQLLWTYPAHAHADHFELRIGIPNPSADRSQSPFLWQLLDVVAGDQRGYVVSGLPEGAWFGFQVVPVLFGEVAHRSASDLAALQVVEAFGRVIERAPSRTWRWGWTEPGNVHTFQLVMDSRLPPAPRGLRVAPGPVAGSSRANPEGRFLLRVTLPNGSTQDVRGTWSEDKDSRLLPLRRIRFAPEQGAVAFGRVDDRLVIRMTLAAGNQTFNVELENQSRNDPALLAALDR